MNTVEPIRDARKIGAIKNMLKGANLRDYALFTVGINTGLRIGDVLALRLGDVLDERGEVSTALRLREQKTNRQTTITLNESAVQALREYLATRDVTDFDAPLFPGRKRDKPLHRVSVHRLVNQWAHDVGLNGGSYGCHSLRKTWGYQARKQGIPIELIQAKLGHRSPAVTRRYIGISQDEIADVESKVRL